MFITARTKTALACAAVVMGALVLTANSANAATILISPGTGSGDDIKNGGFESGTGSGTNRSFTQLDDWFHYTGSNGSAGASKDSSWPHSGTYGGAISTVAQPAANTGHTIAAGDTFSLTFWHKSLTRWELTDYFTLTLYSDAGDIWSDDVYKDDLLTWEEYTANIIPVIPAANIGEILFLRAVPSASVLGATGSGNGRFSAWDDVTLVQTPIAIPEPKTILLGLVGLLGAAMLIRRRRK